MFANWKRLFGFHSRPTGDAATSSKTPPRVDDLGASLREAHHTHIAGAAAEWNSWESRRPRGEVRGLSHGEIQALGEELYFYNPYAHGFINLMALFLTDGLRFEARLMQSEGGAGHDAAAVQAFNHHFQRWSQAQGFPELLTEIATRWLATGECFILNARAAEPWLDPELRLVRNYDVATPAGAAQVGAGGTGGSGGAIEAGIETLPGDATQVAAYHVVTDRLRMATERVGAGAMVHLSLNRWQDQRRGLPVHLAMLDLLRLQQSYLTSVVRTADARSKMAIIRRVQGSPDDVNAMADQERLARANFMTAGAVFPGGAQREVFARPRVVTVNGGVDYDFKSFNLQAEDAHTVNRLLSLPGAAALTLAEYLYSADASATTYASAAAAERAAFKALAARAAVLARGLMPVIGWVHAAFEMQGLIPAGGLEQGRYELGYVLPVFPAPAAGAGSTAAAAGSAQA
ncbi:MAG: phage portal protein [Planctomycetota bacterium]